MGSGGGLPTGKSRVQAYRNGEHIRHTDGLVSMAGVFPDSLRWPFEVHPGRTSNG